MRQRGPDKFAAKDFDAFLEDEKVRIYTAHSRLRITGSGHHGAQPVISSNGDVLLFNGEIYNFEALGEKYLDGDISSSDTYVLANLLSKIGIGVISELEGIFSLVWYSASDKKIYFVRDRFGVKPLFFGFDIYKNLVVASEIKFFRVVMDLLPNKSKKFSSGPSDTHYLGIFEIGRNSIYGFKNRNIVLLENIAKNHDKTVRKISFIQQRNKVRQVIYKVVEKQIPKDVDFGITLSGGIDSSILFFVVKDIVGAADLKTFTYNDGGENDKDSKIVDLITSDYPHLNFKVNRSQIDLELLDECLRIQDEPFISLSVVAQYLVYSEASRKGLRVVLDGQGADELFGGYPRFWRRAFLSNLLRGEFSNLLKILRQSTALEIGLLLGSLPFNSYKITRKLLKNNISMWSTADVYDALLDSECDKGLMTLLRYADRNSMACSIESRVPFLDEEVADLARSIPVQRKLDPTYGTKCILRQAFKDIVPDYILERSDKQGFEVRAGENGVKENWFSNLRGDNDYEKIYTRWRVVNEATLTSR
jgi:asparagine synthase (glutamine-hydrolysing)